jgi:hypothetical protein
VEVDRDVPALVAVDAVHHRGGHRVGRVVVEGPQQRDVEDELAGGDVDRGELFGEEPQRVDEVRGERHEVGVRAVEAPAVDVVVVGQHLRGVGVAELVLDEGVEDGDEARVRRVATLLGEQGAGQPLDAGHVGEALDDGFFFVAGPVRRRRQRPVEVTDLPLVPDAAREHAVEVHGRSVTAPAKVWVEARCTCGCRPAAPKDPRRRLPSTRSTPRR